MKYKICSLILAICCVQTVVANADEIAGRTYYQEICQTMLLFPRDFCTRWVKFEPDGVLSGNQYLKGSYTAAENGQYWLHVNQTSLLVQVNADQLIFVGPRIKLIRLKEGEQLPVQKTPDSLPADRLALQIDFEAWDSRGVDKAAVKAADDLIAGEPGVSRVDKQIWGLHGELSYCITFAKIDTAQTYSAQLIQALEQMGRLRGPVLLKALMTCADMKFPPELPH